MPATVSPSATRPARAAAAAWCPGCPGWLALASLPPFGRGFAVLRRGPL